MVSKRKILTNLKKIKVVVAFEDLAIKTKKKKKKKKKN